MSRKQAPEKNNTPGLLSAVKSAASAALGVQSQANRERDFTSGKPIHFIIAGVLLTLVFLISIGLFVKFMIATSS